MKGVFLGYIYAKTGYKMLNLDTKQVFASRHVKFVETSFPFDNVTATDSEALPTLFPAVPYSTYDNDHITVPHLVTTESFTDHVTHNSAEHVTDSSSTQISSHSHTENTVRPKKTRRVPFKYSDYTGIPTHVSNHSS